MPTSHVGAGCYGAGPVLQRGTERKDWHGDGTYNHDRVVAETVQNVLVMYAGRAVDIQCRGCLTNLILIPRD